MPLDLTAPAAAAPPAAPAPIPPAADPAAAAHPTPPAFVPPATPAAPAQQMIQIPLEQLQAFTGVQARLAEIEAAQRAQQEAAAREVQNALLAKGQAEDAVRLIREESERTLAAERTRLAEEQRRSQNYAIDVEVARAMGTHVFASAVARQAFEAEVRRQLIVEANGNSFAVRTPTFQTAEQVVAGMVANPEYAPFLAPRGNPGGGTAANPAAPAPVNPATQTQPIPAAPAAAPGPKNAGEHLLAWYKEQRAAMGVPPSPSLDKTMPFGIRPAAPR